jgi:hypothetical protein
LTLALALSRPQECESQAKSRSFGCNRAFIKWSIARSSPRFHQPVAVGFSSYVVGFVPSALCLPLGLASTRVGFSLGDIIGRYPFPASTDRSSHDRLRSAQGSEKRRALLWLALVAFTRKPRRGESSLADDATKQKKRA